MVVMVLDAMGIGGELDYGNRENIFQRDRVQVNHRKVIDLYCFYYCLVVHNKYTIMD